MLEALIIIFCYVLGSLPFSYLISRLLGGIDIRSKGSGNIGATNVYRTLGPYIGVAALFADLLKGLIAAFLGLTIGGTVIAAVCGLAAVLGHCFPIFLKFKGGKGVATAAGVMLMLTPMVFIISLVVFAVITFVSRYVSLASVTVAILFPVLTIVMSEPIAYILMAAIIASLVVYRHNENIYRLRQGTESKINEKAI
ncbi:Acyl-phosphate:glycerol-3-phosphate O-acyltransferase PlsY [Candidatus Syntrophocurvum alkaliphilum]|uniref:Glycerol-3-phosphate acyltransferase n=1 Tax=Candidatus Syntrophocurvum alkaliphilum TaxID=2293317 RepID=A0A6I6DHT3_9FIRM|nr:glycerol-3-phosphate 1-O-acyltransferase PlsY [Candidatus Syntrophocurvum alkaliphilum]QGT99833.1 Acyl-phosphate:glycerol-3-phosphate O-acyltransferase PlsY [Candidatus Syntrophocurvum alkaliphilum]